MYDRIHIDENHFNGIKYNTTIKTFANGDRDIKYHSYSNLKGITRKKKSGGLGESSEYQKLKNLINTRTKIIDLIYHNGLIKPWELFITLTFDDNLVNGYSYDDVRTCLVKWLNNQKHQNPNLEYVIVPEYHPSSKRIHFHGVVRGAEKWHLSPSLNEKGRQRIKNGSKIYNLDNYKFGFTTASYIQNAEAVAVYTGKYIIKDFIDIPNCKKYWSSKTLEKPMIEYAQVDESSLNIFINKDMKVDKNLKKTETYTSIYMKCRTSYNIYSVM